jgi:hypothetical protein
MYNLYVLRVEQRLSSIDDILHRSSGVGYDQCTKCAKSEEWRAGPTADLRFSSTCHRAGMYNDGRVRHERKYDGGEESRTNSTAIVKRPHGTSTTHPDRQPSYSLCTLNSVSEFFFFYQQVYDVSVCRYNVFIHIKNRVPK